VNEPLPTEPSSPDSPEFHPTEETSPSKNIVTMVLVSEVICLLLALAGGWLFGVSPFATYADATIVGLSWPFAILLSVFLGTLAAFPLWLGLVAINRVPWRPFQELADFVDLKITPLFDNCSLADKTIISLSAGIAEEALFRGVLQAGLAVLMARVLPIPFALTLAVAISAIIFGVVHWVTTTYAILATLIGVYLSLLWLATGNILAPIACHAVYDFVALVYMTRHRRGI